ncbi:MAG TPA: type II toxin-antitoxin system HicB family antitoxin [Alphaproteobacteria bacterium]|nr:type II toxin-antitoxin system HicB family antitoxin [Alphaproteobacteria bacterium]
MIPDVPYRFTIRPPAEEEGGGCLIEFPDLPGGMSDGETIEEAIMGGLDAMRGWTPAMRAEGHPIPAPLRGGVSNWPMCARLLNRRLYRKAARL